MAELNDKERKEYENLIEKYRNIFKSIYKKYPIVFEHGSPNTENKTKASSIDHAHTHIVNYQYKNEERIIKDLNFNQIGELTQITRKENYILYINPSKVIYMTTNFPPISQMMRLAIAKELNIESKYKWQKEIFEENIEQTIIDITTYQNSEDVKINKGDHE